jgi:hypothetical protein
VTAHPGIPKNPQLLLGDSSALIQLVIAEEIAPFRVLKTNYGVHVAIVGAVEAEIRRKVKSKFPAKIPFLKKLLGNTVSTLDKALLTACGYKSATALLEQIDSLGQQFSLRVDRGEAYTHAASNVLAVPALSQDITALWKLIQDGIDVQRPVLRAFDFLLFGVQAGVMEIEACNRARKLLLKAGESILPCFENCSVPDGLAHFYLRLCDAERQLIGSPKPLDRFDDRIFLRLQTQEPFVSTPTSSPPESAQGSPALKEDADL